MNPLQDAAGTLTEANLSGDVLLRKGGWLRLRVAASVDGYADVEGAVREAVKEELIRNGLHLAIPGSNVPVLTVRIEIAPADAMTEYSMALSLTGPCSAEDMGPGRCTRKPWGSMPRGSTARDNLRNVLPSQAAFALHQVIDLYGAGTSDTMELQPTAADP